MPHKAELASRHFDDVLRYVGEFGLWQKFLYFSSCFFVIVSSAIQIASLVFATGTPKFHCVTPNVTCDENKCCDECTSYSFQESFTSTVTEVRVNRRLPKTNLGTSTVTYSVCPTKQSENIERNPIIPGLSRRPTADKKA